jgi:Protein of unknown function (DUF2442)
MSSPEINRILGARVVGPQMVELRFGDGFVASLDLAPALWGPVFTSLKDPAHFRQLRLEDDTIRWPCGADFCPDVLRYWCETGGVRTQEETDAHFTAQPAAPAAS